MYNVGANVPSASSYPGTWQRAKSHMVLTAILGAHFGRRVDVRCWGMELKIDGGGDRSAPSCTGRRSRPQPPHR
jgi:hypothetical protein